MKVLVIEDNDRLAERIKALLNRLHIVTVTHDGETGLHRALTNEYGLIILDLGLPGMSGHEVCKSIREHDVQTPILILTATEDVLSRVQLLNSGADDYLTKPFSSAELTARVAALIRRQARPMAAETLMVHDLELNRSRREVRRAGKEITLRRKEYDILEYLVTNRGRAVSRDMIINHAWHDNADGWNNTVDVHIKHLRDKIDKPFKQQLIKTAYGYGYMVDDAVQSNQKEKHHAKDNS